MRSEQEVKDKLKEFEEILKTNPRFYGCLAYEFYAQKDALEWVLGLKELLVPTT